MRRFAAIPVTELLIIAILAGIVAICWMGWQVIGPNDGPPPMASKQFKVIGNQLWQNGRHVGNWIPPQDGEPGRWEATEFVMPEPLP